MRKKKKISNGNHNHNIFFVHFNPEYIMFEPNLRDKIAFFSLFSLKKSVTRVGRTVEPRHTQSGRGANSKVYAFLRVESSLLLFVESRIMDWNSRKGCD